MDELPIILSDKQAMNDKVYRIHEDSLSMPAETESCLVGLRELGVTVYKRLVEKKTIIFVHKPAKMTGNALKQWEILETLLGRPALQTPPSPKRIRKVSYADDILGYGRHGGEEPESQQALEKYIYGRTRDELTVHKTQQSIVLDDHRDTNHLSLMELGPHLINIEANPNPQGLSGNPSNKTSSVYKRFNSGIYNHHSDNVMARGDQIPVPGNREVKTWFHLPHYAIPESVMESTPRSTIQLHPAGTTPQLIEASNVVLIKFIDLNTVPNGLKGIHNLFSNYGNVEKVVYNPRECNCLVYYQIAMGATIAYQELSSLEHAVEGLDLSTSACSNQYMVESDAQIYVPDPHHARFKNKVPTIVNAPGRTVHFSIFGLGDHIVQTKALERFLQQHCYPLRVKRESKDQNMWFVELQSIQAACSTLMRLHDEPYNEGGYIRVSFTKTKPNQSSRSSPADESGLPLAIRRNRR